MYYEYIIICGEMVWRDGSFNSPVQALTAASRRLHDLMAESKDLANGVYEIIVMAE